MQKFKAITFPAHDIQAILTGRKTMMRQAAEVPDDAYIKQGGLAYYSPMQNQEVVSKQMF